MKDRSLELCVLVLVGNTWTSKAQPAATETLKHKQADKGLYKDKDRQMATNRMTPRHNRKTDRQTRSTDETNRKQNK